MREIVSAILGLGLCGAVLNFGGRDRGRGRRRGRGGLSVHELEELGGLELEEPVAVAALFPFGEVLFGDGTVFEVSGEDGFDVGERVEPGKDGFGGDAVVEFEVELFADGVSEASDFADTRCSFHNYFYFSFWEEV